MSFFQPECPIKITPRAMQVIQSVMHEKGVDTRSYGLRVGIRGGGCGGASPLLGFDTALPTDEQYALENFSIFVEKKHLMYLIDLEIDYEESEHATGFVFNSPNG
jgi:iron-sulfur cluster assembly protein